MQASLNTAVEIRFDGDGFRVDPSAWDEAVAEHIASADGLDHRDDVQPGVLRSLRQKFWQTRPHDRPEPRLSPHRPARRARAACVLKPREAWRVGSLPNPGDEANAYL